MREDYSRAKTLATFEHLGVAFRVVRRRFNGKHWRGYLALLCGDVPMTHDDYKEGCATTAAIEWKEKVARLFSGPGSEERMANAINNITSDWERAT